jgi:hypothetical protein
MPFAAKDFFFEEASVCTMAYIPRSGFALQRRLLQADCQEKAMIRKIILAATLAASFGGIAPAAAAVIVVLVAPPPPRAEVSPPPRLGHMRVAGHWEWRHQQWVRGSWIRERHGYYYNQPTWVERDGRWHMERGSWRRGDNDGDGVPNGQDRAPDNPYRH